MSREAALEALEHRRQFNVVDFETGWKADLIVRKDRPYSIEEFRRRQPEPVLGTTLFVASAEDVVVSKLEWARRSGGSERQLRDVRGVVLAVGDALDRAYVEQWVAALGVEDLWAQVR